MALLATTTFLIFDPLRCWFVENKFSSRFEVSNLKKIVTDWWMGLSEQVKFLSVLSTREKHSPDDSESWKERQVEEARLLAIHKETPER